MLWVPQDFVDRELEHLAREEEQLQRELAYRAYHEAHERCPECKGDFVETTCVGYLGEDRNRAWCACGWRGIVHDMVAAPRDRKSGKKTWPEGARRA